MQINRVTVPRGYVNATQMCKANGKFWANYKDQKSTNEYWQGLADDMGIPISSLTLELEGFRSDQGTWVHPLIATDLAQWVSVGFRIWANRVLVEKIIAVEQRQVAREETLAKLFPEVPNDCNLKFQPEFIELATKVLRYKGGWNTNAYRNFLYRAIAQ